MPSWVPSPRAPGGTSWGATWARGARRRRLPSLGGGVRRGRGEGQGGARHRATRGRGKGEHLERRGPVAAAQHRVEPRPHVSPPAPRGVAGQVEAVALADGAPEHVGRAVDPVGPVAPDDDQRQPGQVVGARQVPADALPEGERGLVVGVAVHLLGHQPVVGARVPRRRPRPPRPPLVGAGALELQPVPVGRLPLGRDPHPFGLGVEHRRHSGAGRLRPRARGDARRGRRGLGRHHPRGEALEEPPRRVAGQRAGGGRRQLAGRRRVGEVGGEVRQQRRVLRRGRLPRGPAQVLVQQEVRRPVRGAVEPPRHAHVAHARRQGPGAPPHDCVPRRPGRVQPGLQGPQPRPRPRPAVGAALPVARRLPAHVVRRHARHRALVARAMAARYAPHRPQFLRLRCLVAPQATNWWSLLIPLLRTD